MWVPVVRREASNAWRACIWVRTPMSAEVSAARPVRGSRGSELEPEPAPTLAPTVAAPSDPPAPALAPPTPPVSPGLRITVRVMTSFNPHPPTFTPKNQPDQPKSATITLQRSRPNSVETQLPRSQSHVHPKNKRSYPQSPQNPKPKTKTQDPHPQSHRSHSRPHPTESQSC